MLSKRTLIATLILGAIIAASSVLPTASHPKPQTQTQTVVAASSTAPIVFHAPQVEEPTTSTTVSTTTTTAPQRRSTTTTAPRRTQVVAPAASRSRATGDPSSDASWDRLAQCESGGRWNLNSGNGYYGGLQFSLSSWHAVGGTGSPHEHSRSEQIAAGKRLWQSSGWGAWPGCTRSFGWR